VALGAPTAVVVHTLRMHYCQIDNPSLILWVRRLKLNLPGVVPCITAFTALTGDAFLPPSWTCNDGGIHQWQRLTTMTTRHRHAYIMKGTIQLRSPSAPVSPGRIHLNVRGRAIIEYAKPAAIHAIMPNACLLILPCTVHQYHPFRDLGTQGQAATLPTPLHLVR
jgi:hypothetical protein